MNKKLILLIVLFIILATLATIMFTGSNFDIEITYGEGGYRQFSTFTNRFSASYTEEGKISVKMKLSKETKQKVLDKVIELDLMNYPDSFPEYKNITTETEENFVTIKLKGEKKTIYWNEKNKQSVKYNQDGVAYFENEKDHQYIEILYKFIEFMDDDIIRDEEEYSTFVDKLMESTQNK